MSHGGLNILGKKSWNVWNRDNRERVARDEAKAEEESTAKKRRADAAEQDARLEVLRSRSHRAEHDEVKREVGLVRAEGALFDAKTGHINLFTDADAKGGAQNAEAEAEKKAVKEAEERRLGIVKYLDEGTKSKQWYERTGAPEAESDETKSSKSAEPAPRFPLSAETRKRYDEKRKERADPMGQVSALLTAAAPRPSVPKTSKAPAKPAYDNLAALRAEREARERAERARIEQLTRPGSAAPPARHSSSSTKGGYNSGYMRR